MQGPTIRRIAVVQPYEDADSKLFRLLFERVLRGVEVTADYQTRFIPDNVNSRTYQPKIETILAIFLAMLAALFAILVL